MRVHDLRAGAEDARRSVDDSPFGGGAGMVLMPEPLFRSVESVPDLPRPLYLLSPGGRRFDQSVAAELAGPARQTAGGFSLLCGRYEGVDQRVADHLVDGELSVGDYVLAGGELAALVVRGGGGPPAAGRARQRGLGARRQLLGRAARIPPVHPAGRIPGLGRCPRSCARETTAPWRPGGAPRPCSGRRSAGPTCSSAWSREVGLGPDDVRALVEHGYDVPSGPGPGEPHPTEPE